jgi:hypothetical protein
MTTRDARADQAMRDIWEQWFQFYQAHFRADGIAISAADQIAFYEIAQPILRGLVAGATAPYDPAAAVAEEKRMRSNWRGRRLRACRTADEFSDLVGMLGVEDGSQCLRPEGMPTPPTPAQKRELQNTVANLLRTFLLWNDGSVSHQTLERF